MATSVPSKFPNPKINFVDNLDSDQRELIPPNIHSSEKHAEHGRLIGETWKTHRGNMQNMKDRDFKELSFTLLSTSSLKDINLHDGVIENDIVFDSQNALIRWCKTTGKKLNVVVERFDGVNQLIGRLKLH